MYQQLDTNLHRQTSPRGLLGGEQMLEQQQTATNRNTGGGSMLIRKDFKIIGTINNQKKGDKPSLSYISLIHQIEAGMKQNYPDSEIVSAVIRALQPGMRLRTVLETLPNLEIPRLRLMLRSHYSEKGAAELFQSLTNSIQHPEEEADEFLIRVYETRQKLLFAKREAGLGPVVFDDTLIQSVFINTIETGLTSESIRNKVRQYLITPKTGETEDQFQQVNDQLIYQMSMATAEENERTAKLQAVRKRTGCQRQQGQQRRSHQRTLPS
jgi:hypothetical protein